MQTSLRAIAEQAKKDEMFYRKLRERLAKFCLELAEEKTRIISFSRFRKYENTSFSFLGIEFRWGVSNSGKDIIKRRTDRKRLQRAFSEMTEWCRENRHQRIRKQVETMKQKLRGHYNYYGIAGNSDGIQQFFDGVMRIWYRWLNRRSQHRSYTWNGFKEMTRLYEIPRPKVVEQWWIKPYVQYCLELT